MITVGVIRDGGSYLTQHLRQNDYWAEGENEVYGEWIGRGADRLGLEGIVTDAPFEALRLNRDWQTGERLTARENKKVRMALFDIQISAPKDVSVLALVGEDERVREAFVESVKEVLHEMESFAAVRERRGEARDTEAFRLTGNFTGAIFLHDASRDLDPQLHVHAVLANVTWDGERSRWMALQHAEIMRASPYLRQVFYRELASRLRALGYEPYEMSTNGFSIRGVEHLRERFSKRARQVKALTEEFSIKKGRRATKREVEVLVRESRSKKLVEISTSEVRARQRAELTVNERHAMEHLVRQSMTQAHKREVSLSPITAKEALDVALRHVYERRSVAREGEVLSAALELQPRLTDWRALRRALRVHPDVLLRNGEMTLHSIRREEAISAQRIQTGRNTRMRLGSADQLSEKLTKGQRQAAIQLLGNKDFLSLLIGDAGTGKTTVLTAIENAHVAAGGARFLALAPTTRARDALVEAGFPQSQTVQRFLVSESLQTHSTKRVLLVDEAGLLSTHQLDQLTAIAEKQHARLILVGDTKQHYSVQRGDGLRHILQHTHTPVVRLSEVLRQRGESDRQLSRLMASGQSADALLYAERQGLVHDAKDDDALFAAAAERYAQNLAEDIETLVVIPTWEEIDRFNQHARASLRSKELLGEEEVEREAIKPLSWTVEEKRHWDRYQIGDRLLFTRDTQDFRRSTAVAVVAVLPNGVQVRDDRNTLRAITKKQIAAFEVGRAETLRVAAGDRLLIRGNYPTHRFTNGDIVRVARVDVAAKEIVLIDGRHLPAEFKAWTHGHAVTAYRSQGSTAEQSLLVLGEGSARALSQRQFYVASTRYRGAHRIYVTNKEQVFRQLRAADTGRELATEFVERRRLTMQEMMSHRRLHRRLENIRNAIRASVVNRHSMRETIRQHQKVRQRMSM